MRVTVQIPYSVQDVLELQKRDQREAIGLVVNPAQRTMFGTDTDGLYRLKARLTSGLFSTNRTTAETCGKYLATLNTKIQQVEMYEAETRKLEARAAALDAERTALTEKGARIAGEGANEQAANELLHGLIFGNTSNITATGEGS